MTAPEATTPEMTTPEMTTPEMTAPEATTPEDMDTKSTTPSKKRAYDDDIIVISDDECESDSPVHEEVPSPRKKQILFKPPPPGVIRDSQPTEMKMQHSNSDHQQIMEIIRYQLPKYHVREIDVRAAHWLGKEAIRKSVLEVELMVANAFFDLSIDDMMARHLIPSSLDRDKLLDYKTGRRTNILKPTEDGWCVCNLRKWRLVGSQDEDASITLRDPMTRQIHHIRIDGEIVSVPMKGSPVLFMKHDLLEQCDHVMSEQFVPVSRDITLVCGLPISHLTDERRFFWPVHRFNQHLIHRDAQPYLIRQQELYGVICQVEAKILRFIRSTGLSVFTEGTSSFLSTDTLMREKHRVKGINLEIAMLWALTARMIQDGKSGRERAELQKSMEARGRTLMDCHPAEALVTAGWTTDQDQSRCHVNPWVWEYEPMVQGEFGPWLQIKCIYTEQTGCIHLPSLRWFIDKPFRTHEDESQYTRRMIHTENRCLHGVGCSHGIPPATYHALGDKRIGGFNVASTSPLQDIQLRLEDSMWMKRRFAFWSQIQEQRQATPRGVKSDVNWTLTPVLLE